MISAEAGTGMPDRKPGILSGRASVSLQSATTRIAGGSMKPPGGQWHSVKAKMANFTRYAEKAPIE
jgi:hypothetical protein